MAIALVGALAVAATAYGRPAASTAPNAAAASTAISCRSPQIGLMAPLTGDAASVGQEQGNWAKYAAQRFNASQKKIRARMVDGDTQLDPAQASTVGQRFASNSAIAGIVGPAGSQEIIAVSPIFRRAGLAYVSGSATRTTLTNGSNRGFFRVVPNDGVQGPTIARYIARTIKARKVMIVDDQTAYSVPLSNSIQANLRAANVDVDRQSVNQDQSDFSSIVSRIASDTRVVVLAWQLAAKAQVFGQQMREQGKTATIVGTDGLFSPSDFKINGSYVAAFAPDIRTIPASRKFVAGYNARYGKNWGTFGPPTYAAAWAMLKAIQKACADNRATRAEVLKFMRQTSIPPKDNVLGGTLRFTANGDVRGAKFYMFQIRNGQYVTVG